MGNGVSDILPQTTPPAGEEGGEGWEESQGGGRAQTA